ncbi:MAG: hypothetical protein PHU12_01885 [Candidatus Aenigmarchaeota archaeon]|nr:hypothetical protein [Candidatus Aenigmarchaeota archaeon]
MDFMKWTKPILTIIEVLIGMVALMVLTVFAMKPTDTAMLTNALLAILILVQLIVVNVLLGTHVKGGRKR